MLRSNLSVTIIWCCSVQPYEINVQRSIVSSGNICWPSELFFAHFCSLLSSSQFSAFGARSRSSGNSVGYQCIAAWSCLGTVQSCILDERWIWNHWVTSLLHTLLWTKWPNGRTDIHLFMIYELGVWGLPATLGTGWHHKVNATPAF